VGCSLSGGTRFEHVDRRPPTWPPVVEEQATQGRLPPTPRGPGALELCRQPVALGLGEAFLLNGFDELRREVTQRCRILCDPCPGCVACEVSVGPPGDRLASLAVRLLRCTTAGGVSLRSEFGCCSFREATGDAGLMSRACSLGGVAVRRGCRRPGSRGAHRVGSPRRFGCGLGAGAGSPGTPAIGTTRAPHPYRGTGS
jgi:hypothetical protein